MTVYHTLSKKICCRSYCIDSQRVNLSTRRLNLSTQRLNLSTQRVNLSIQRPNLSTQRVNLSIQRPNLSTQRVNLSIQRVNLSTRRVNLSILSRTNGAQSFDFHSRRADFDAPSSVTLFNQRAFASGGRAIAADINVLIDGIQRRKNDRLPWQ
jgi:hypothetical protein